MTATTSTRRNLTRTVVLAGIVTASTATLTGFAPDAAGADHGVVKTAERTAAPVAAEPQGHGTIQGKAPLAEDQNHGRSSDRADEQDQKQNRNEKQDQNQDRAKGEDRGGEDREQQVTKGRGAEYRADGTLITTSPAEQPTPKPASSEDIDRWIDQALKVMDKNDIPGSYESIHRNLMRESAGDPLTINTWDTNAEQNIPSKGLLQVIDPTFEQYHVKGTAKDPFDPVANIAAASNYAADRYGSMDNVDSAY